MQVTDNGYPNPQFDTATAIITVDRDLNLPVFTSNARYAVTIDETSNIGASILNVQASRLNLVVCKDISKTGVLQSFPKSYVRLPDISSDIFSNSARQLKSITNNFSNFSINITTIWKNVETSGLK